MQPLELYIHIPFCVKKCAYCDFLSGPAGEKEKEEYVKMLVDEIRNCPDTVQNYKVISIFFGGGTPSLLTGEQIGRLMDTVREIFTLDEDAEITMEMNPGTVTEEKLRKYRQAGVNRLSIGLQSVNDEELRLLGRIHTYEEFLEAADTDLFEKYKLLGKKLDSVTGAELISSGESQWFCKYQCRPDLGNSGADGGKLEAYTGAGNGTFPGAYFCI